MHAFVYQHFSFKAKSCNLLIYYQPHILLRLALFCVCPMAMVEHFAHPMAMTYHFAHLMAMVEHFACLTFMAEW